MTDEELKARFDKLENLVDQPKKPKDGWDKISISASGFAVIVGLIFTINYNIQQKNLVELQTIEKFIPHLTDSSTPISQQKQRLAILAVLKLRNVELAIELAEMYPGKGTTEALISIAEEGADKEKDPARKALSKVLINHASEGNIELVGRILKLKIHPDTARDEEEATALMKAMPYREIVRLLLLNKADVNLVDGSNWTPIMYAAWNGKAEVILDLINAGAKMGKKDWRGRTELMIAAEAGMPDAVRVLIEKGSQLEERDNSGLTALMIPASFSLSEAERKAEGPQGLLRATKVLIDSGAAINARSGDGNTAIMHAAINDNTEMVRLIAEAGADLSVNNQAGKTVLKLAAQKGDVEMIKAVGCSQKTQVVQATEDSVLNEKPERTEGAVGTIKKGELLIVKQRTSVGGQEWLHVERTVSTSQESAHGWVSVTTGGRRDNARFTFLCERPVS